MRPALLVLFTITIFLVQGQQTAPVQNTEPLVIKGSVTLSASAEEIISRMNRAWKYSFGQEPAAKLLDKSSDQMTAKAHFYYKSETLTAREDTRGIISYNIVLQAQDGKCNYTIDQFVHRGNTTSRGGGIHFGRLMKGLDPGRKVRGLGRRNIQRIHEDMKLQVEKRMNKLLEIFEQQLILEG